MTRSELIFCLRRVNQTFKLLMPNAFIDEHERLWGFFGFKEADSGVNYFMDNNKFHKFPTPAEMKSCILNNPLRPQKERVALPEPKLSDDQKLMKKYSRQLREETLKIFKKVKYRFVDREVDLTLYKPDGSILYHAPDDRYPDKTVGVDKHTFRVAEKMDSSVKRWKAISNPIFRYEWFKKHTDMPDRLLNEIKISPEYKEAVENLKKGIKL